jgi:DNA polymerase III epsilon subunit-like protein
MGIHAVIDFETTGLSPALGARPTEVAIVLKVEAVMRDAVQFVGTHPIVAHK